METVSISNEKLDVTIKLTGAELTSIKYYGKEMLWQGDPNFWKGQAPVLFPIAGGIKDDKYCIDGKEYPIKKHGLVRYLDYKILLQQDDKVVLTASQTETTLESFPFNFNFTVTYQVKGKTLSVEYKVENTDDKTMYYSIGSHEGYVIEGEFTDYSIKFNKKENIYSYNLIGNLIDHNYTNLGENTKTLQLNYDYFNVDALVLKDLKSRKVTLQKNNKKILSVSFKDVDHMLIWTRPNAPFVCIEPWSATPDYIDGSKDIKEKMDITSLAPNGVKKYTHKIKF